MSAAELFLRLRERGEVPPAGPILDLSRAVGLVAGIGVLGLAAAVAWMDTAPASVMDGAVHVLGVAFPALYAVLVAAALYCWLRLLAGSPRAFWSAAGLQAAQAIATLALTFTLFGISLGIGELAQREITPETVQRLVADLTARFSLAFLSTVVGLPTAAGLRALITLTAVRAAARETRPAESPDVAAYRQDDRAKTTERSDERCRT